MAEAELATRRQLVCTLDELQPGEKRPFELGGRPIVVCRSRETGEVFAVAGRCPHQGAPLCEGKLGSSVSSSGPGQYEVTRPGEILRCPWHGWEFDVRTGQSWFDPQTMRVKAYAVAVVPGRTLVPPAEGLLPGPYVAETYPVSIDQDYLVVEL